MRLAFITFVASRSRRLRMTPIGARIGPRPFELNFTNFVKSSFFIQSKTRSKSVSMSLTLPVVGSDFCYDYTPLLLVVKADLDKPRIKLMELLVTTLVADELLQHRRSLALLSPNMMPHYIFYFCSPFRSLARFEIDDFEVGGCSGLVSVTSAFLSFPSRCSRENPSSFNQSTCVHFQNQRNVVEIKQFLVLIYFEWRQNLKQNKNNVILAAGDFEHRYCRK